MTITETPKVKISRANSSMLRIGNGTQIPIFIGVTGNSTAATGILQFKMPQNLQPLFANEWLLSEATLPSPHAQGRPGLRAPRSLSSASSVSSGSPSPQRTTQAPGLMVLSS